MTEFQKQQIQYLRMQGCSFKEIAAVHQLPIDEVKQYCTGKPWDNYKKLIEADIIKNSVKIRAKKTI